MQHIVIQPKDEREEAFLKELLDRLHVRYELTDLTKSAVTGSSARDYLQDLYDSREDSWQERGESM